MLSKLFNNLRFSSNRIQLSLIHLNSLIQNKPNELVTSKPKLNKSNQFNVRRTNSKRTDNYEKNFIFRGKSNQYDKGLDEDENPEDELKLGQDLDLYSKSKGLYHKKVIADDVKQRQRVKHGIIMKRMNTLEGNKYKYLNLLTWDAKEQIKYLHLNEPEYWTVEHIVESYPITEESCRKLLRSKWAPKTLDDLAKHDEKVIENWKQLTQSENTEPAGPAINIYEEYKRSNKLALLKNACGLPDIEFKRQSIIFSDSFSIHETVLCKPGKFSSLILRDKEKMEKLFNKNREEPKQLNSGKKIDNSIESHFFQTKQELAKSLEKLSIEMNSNSSIKKDENF